MRFNPAAFDRHLNNIGQEMRWRRSYACACSQNSSGSADPSHQLCMGRGRIWDPPVKAVAGVASQQVQMQWQAMGQFESGDMVLSVPQNSPLWNAGQFDRILMMNSTDVFSMPLQRGGPSERILFPVASFTRCFWLHPQNREQTVEGGLPAVDDAGRLTWPNGGEPPAGVKYSITGEKRDEYFVFLGIPSDRNEHKGMRLPRRIVARKWDLFGRVV